MPKCTVYNSANQSQDAYVQTSSKLCATEDALSGGISESQSKQIETRPYPAACTCSNAKQSLRAAGVYARSFKECRAPNWCVTISVARQPGSSDTFLCQQPPACLCMCLHIWWGDTTAGSAPVSHAEFPPKAMKAALVP